MKKNVKMKKNNDKELWTYHQTENANNLLSGHPRQDMLCKNIEKKIKHGKILEIGFGDGYLLNKLSKRYECYGADISNENINQMKLKIKNVNFDLIDIDGRLPYDNSSFDGFIASEVLEHMSNEELKICISEIKRVLKSGGYGFITFPAEENLTDNECFCPNCKTKFHKWGHKQSWNNKKINEVFRDFILLKNVKFLNVYTGQDGFKKVASNILQIFGNVIFKVFNMEGLTYFSIVRKK